MSQIYEEYWKLTLAWTDFNETRFLDALRTSIHFIDKKRPQEYSAELYQNLQTKLTPVVGLIGTSLRKGINQLIKLGFINYHLLSYHPLAKEYIKDNNTNAQRRLILSKIMYANSSFNRSVTADSHKQEINFFVKTLEYCQILEEKFLGVMMTLNTDDYPAGYATKRELEIKYKLPAVKDFIERKYNQIAYLGNVLKKLDGIACRVGNYLLEKDLDNIQLETEIRLRDRDPYLQKIYKRQLQKESSQIFGNAKCMVEGLTYPVLVASHIKPFRISNDNEAFDPNNGLLLSKTLDSLFDLNYISFEDDGYIIFYNRVSDDVKNFWKTYKLDTRFLTPARLIYLAEHRELCKIKNA